MVARFDPELPISVLIAKREVFALDTIDHTLTNVLGFKHIGHQHIGAPGNSREYWSRSTSTSLSTLPETSDCA